MQILPCHSKVAFAPAVNLVTLGHALKAISQALDDRTDTQRVSSDRRQWRVLYGQPSGTIAASDTSVAAGGGSSPNVPGRRVLRLLNRMLHNQAVYGANAFDMTVQPVALRDSTHAGRRAGHNYIARSQLEVAGQIGYDLRNFPDHLTEISSWQVSPFTLSQIAPVSG